MAYFTGWSEDVWDDLASAVADTVADRASEIAAKTGLKAPSVYPFINARVMAANSIEIDWAGSDIDLDERTETVTLEIQYIYRAVRPQTADAALRKVGRRIFRIILDDRLHYLWDGGFVVTGDPRVSPGIVREELLDEDVKQEYEGVVLYVDFARPFRT